MPTLSTHVLDLVIGLPAAGVRVVSHAGSGSSATVLADVMTNADGRTDASLLPHDAPGGTYRLEFHVGDYFAAGGHADARKFLDVVPIVFRVGPGDGRYHVPLLVSPWAYSTYRGS